MTTRQTRLTRGAAASAVATVLAAVSHTVGGGAAPHPLLVVALAVLLTAPAAVLVGRRPHPARVTATVLLAQAAFHGVFELLGAPVAAAGGVVAGHVHGAVALPAIVVTHEPPMLLAHLMAAAVTVPLLWHGERMLRTIARWVRVHLRRAVPLRPTLVRLPRLLAPRAIRARSRAVGIASPRGPPRVA